MHRRVDVLNNRKRQNVEKTKVASFFCRYDCNLWWIHLLWKNAKLMKLAPSASSRPGWASERWNALNVNKINPLPANFANPSNPSEEVSKYFFFLQNISRYEYFGTLYTGCHLCQPWQYSKRSRNRGWIFLLIFQELLFELTRGTQFVSWAYVLLSEALSDQGQNGAHKQTAKTHKHENR